MTTGEAEALEVDKLACTTKGRWGFLLRFRQRFVPLTERGDGGPCRPNVTGERWYLLFQVLLASARRSS